MRSLFDNVDSCESWLRNQGVQDIPGGMKVRIIAQMLVEAHDRDVIRVLLRDGAKHA